MIRLILVLLLFASIPQSANSQAWGTKYDVLLEQENAEVEVTTTKKGKETRTFTLPGPVIVEERRHGDEYHASVTDKSGHGAIMCAWIIYSDILYAAEFCSNLRTPELMERLTEAVDRIEDFYRQNQFPALSDTPLATMKPQYRERQVQQYGPPGGTLRCENPSLALFVRRMLKGDRAKFDAKIDDLLSVPRPPVFSPCL